jgi:hypothetical protein
MGSARAFGGRGLTTTNFEAVSAVDRLDIEDFATRESQDAFHGRRNVFVHPVWKFDDDYRPLARCTHEPSPDGPRPPPKFAQDDVHTSSVASYRVPSTAS